MGNHLCLPYISFTAIKILEEMVIKEIKAMFYVKTMKSSYAMLPGKDVGYAKEQRKMLASIQESKQVPVYRLNTRSIFLCPGLY